MTGISPEQVPNARSYLTQQLVRFQLAVKDIRTEIDCIELKFREVQKDFILVIAALDDLEAEARKDAAA